MLEVIPNLQERIIERVESLYFLPDSRRFLCQKCMNLACNSNQNRVKQSLFIPLSERRGDCRRTSRIYAGSIKPIDLLGFSIKAPDAGLERYSWRMAGNG